MNEEYLVFTGRPNAGKSSIIREVMGIQVITGKHPGTTRRISKYALSENLFLVDMPGYGRMTGVSKRYENMRKNQIIRFLVSNAQNIALAIHVLDISTFLEVTWRMEKKGMLSLDVEMVQYLTKTLGDIPLVVANKIDKARKDEIAANLEELKNRISDGQPPVPKDYIFPVSARTGKGLDMLKSAIHTRLAEKGHRTLFKKR